MNVILGALVRRIKQRVYLDTDEEIARWIEEYCEQSNSHKHGVMQGLLLKCTHCQGTGIEPNSTDYSKPPSSSPTVGDGVAGQNVRGGICKEDYIHWNESILKCRCCGHKKRA